MSDYYKGFEGTDSVDGTEEGDDMVETFGGNDYVSGFKDSYINTAMGKMLSCCRRVMGIMSLLLNLELIPSS